MSQSQSRVGRRLAAPFSTWPRRTAWTAAAAPVAIMAALGGLAPAPADPVADVSAGETIDLGRLTVELVGWEVRDVAGDALEDYPGADSWLFLEAVMQTATMETEPVTADVFVLPDEVLLDRSEPDPHRMMLLRDATRNPRLQPGIPERVIFVWPIASDSIRDATTLPLQLIADELLITTDGQELWVEGDVAATTDVPRDDQVGLEFVQSPSHDSGDATESPS